jgi:Ca2+-binding EF-hand superfamily protein
MKSKINRSLTLFLCALILTMTISVVFSVNINTSMELESTNKVTDKALSGSSLTRKDLANYWKELFSGSREGTCTKANAKKNALAKLKREAELITIGRNAEKTKLPWVKNWGYGDAAYFFDFLDPVFMKTALDLFEESFETLLSIENKDTKDYKDVFDIERLKKQNKLKNQKKLFENIDPIIHNNSINTVQLNKAMKDWGWFISPGLRDYAYDLVSRYDVDGDGRLNPREMILATIWHNKNIIGKGDCMYCFAELARKLDAMFIFLDCTNSGAISVEDLWEKLPKLVRSDNRWNIFAIENNDNIRTSALNDFCLKNGQAKQGFITKSEFRTGILLGLWDRQTNRKEIIKDDSRSLRELRWDETGMVDKIAFGAYLDKLKTLKK